MDFPHNVQPLEIPVSPPEKEIKAWGHTVDAYGPLFWNLMYLGHRYLENMDDKSLSARYCAIVNNFQHLATATAYSLPIDSHLSAWYWHRKEYQTRLEFALRKLKLPIDPLVTTTGKPIGGRPGTTKQPPVFRYGESKHMKGLIELGDVRFGPASYYLKGTMGDPRTDDELTRTSYLYGKQTQIVTQSGTKIPVLGDVKVTASAENYYVLCTSQRFSNDLFNDFGCDACVVINDAEEFAMRINKTLPRGWALEHSQVEYFDPYEHGLANLDPLLSKDFSFAYQLEYRFILIPDGPVEADKFFYLRLGNLSDIATFIDA
jgi:hypothetical protein